ncbi:MAG: response regulator [Gammaproteobacteria bacterium]|jgi:DNA-binding response OmpR family regulator|nr:response regulator [Gammaproteobacteria bacterium]MBT4076131.1 response regulator [Gammaproteobacteria bacterium]MBT4195829.1 response regulator [Gammaproteobacteria bacterium]MBT4448937.1 response regulator [Gammaproteobacteria bacterium]MBT4861599.1 response regulator [Gammaproteobacteria bacterium]
MLFKKRLLIIDSSDSARTILFKELLTNLPDIDIIACGTAKEALTATKRFNFEIITTGLSLPDMGGQEMITEIRKQQKNVDTPIFVVSGDTHTHIINTDEDSTASAITAYFDKAEGHKALVDFICNFLGKDNTIAAKILYVDQSATSAAITSSILEKNNFNFLHVKTGEMALNELRRDYDENKSCSYDVLITDLTLNMDMSGFELIQSVRRELDFDYQTLPILLMTVEPEENEKTDFTGIFGAGTNDFITKPISEEVLVERIINLINIKRQNEALQG